MKIIGTVAVVIVATIWNAYVGMILWRWFMIPILSLRAITVFEAWCIGLVVRTLGGSQSTAEKRKGEDADARILRLVLTAFFAPLIALVFGWIARGFL